jgi:hypothetical protein
MIAIFMKASGASVGPSNYFKPKAISAASANSNASKGRRQDKASRLGSTQGNTAVTGS